MATELTDEQIIQIVFKKLDHNTHMRLRNIAMKRITSEESHPSMAIREWNAAYYEICNMYRRGEWSYDDTPDCQLVSVHETLPPLNTEVLVYTEEHGGIWNIATLEKNDALNSENKFWWNIDGSGCGDDPFTGQYQHWQHLPPARKSFNTTIPLVEQ